MPLNQTKSTLEAGIYIIPCKTCENVYVSERSRSLKK